MHEYYDDYDDADDTNEYNPDEDYKHYFKFDPAAWDAWGKWLYDALNDIVEPSPNVWYAFGFPTKSFPVNDWFSNTANGNSFLYLGNNQYQEPIWKAKYFARDKTQEDYIKHLQSHIIHFVKQPAYYKGLFDILN